jgi:hypothetical protein
MKYCLWSAEGLAYFRFSENEEKFSLDLDYTNGDRRTLKTGMPSKDEWLSWFAVVKQSLIDNVDKVSPLLFHNKEAVVVEEQINTVPLTYKKSLAQIKQSFEGADEELAKYLYKEQFKTVNQMDGFRTRCLVRLNAGSNDDTFRYLSLLKPRLRAGVYKNRYCPLMVDCNIFDRLLRVRSYNSIVFISF